jgi:polysaccharide biosynthesis transport protein
MLSVMSQLTPYSGEAPLAYPEPGQSHPTDGRDIERLYTALLKRWRLFLAVAGGFVALVGIVTLLTPKSYTTTVRLLAGRSDTTVTNSDNATALPVLNALVLQSGEQSVETLADLAQQSNIAEAVIQQLNLKVSPQALLSRVSVHPLVNTALLALNVAWKSPEQSAQIANAFANAFVDQERDFVRAEAVAAMGFLSKELPNAEAKMQQTASRLAQFQSTHGYIDATAHEQAVVTRMGAMDQQLDQLSVDSSEAQALLKSVNSQLAALSSTVDSAKQVDQNPVSTDLQSKLAEVNTELSEAEQKYTPEHPAVIALRQQQKALLAQISAQPSAVVGQTTVAPNPLYQSLQQQAATYTARIQGDQGQIRALQAQRKAYRPTEKSLPQQAVQFAAIQEEAKRAASVYNALEQKYNDALVAETTAISDIVIVQPATADAASKRPNLRTNLAIALVIGLLLGLATVYILDLIENRASRKDFAKVVGLPIVARIPSFDAKHQRALPWVQSMTVEAFLHLCVTLRLTSRPPVKTLAILSARRSAGKSTVAYHLAKSLATLQPGILLVDGDLRQPTIHHQASCPNEIGLSDVLNGSAALDEAVQHVAPGLDVLTSGPDMPNPISALESHFDSVMENARSAYSMIIIDTPALRAVSDGFMIAANVDGSLMIVAANETEESEARGAVTELHSLGIDNVLGIVVNKDAVKINDYDDYFARMHRALTAGPA